MIVNEHKKYSLNKLSLLSKLTHLDLSGGSYSIEHLDETIAHTNFVNLRSISLNDGAYFGSLRRTTTTLDLTKFPKLETVSLLRSHFTSIIIAAGAKIPRIITDKRLLFEQGNTKTYIDNDIWLQLKAHAKSFDNTDLVLPTSIRKSQRSFLV